MKMLLNTATNSITEKRTPEDRNKPEDVYEAERMHILASVVASVAMVSFKKREIQELFIYELARMASEMLGD